MHLNTLVILGKTLCNTTSGKDLLADKRNPTKHNTWMISMPSKHNLLSNTTNLPSNLMEAVPALTSSTNDTTGHLSNTRCFIMEEFQEQVCNGLHRDTKTLHRIQDLISLSLMKTHQYSMMTPTVEMPSKQEQLMLTKRVTTNTIISLTRSQQTNIQNRSIEAMMLGQKLLQILISMSS